MGFASRIGGKIAAVGALLGASLSVASAVAMVKSQMSVVDALAKTSDQLGIATKDLAAFQLQADLAGVSSEQFSTNIRKMIRSIADAAEGSKSARAALGSIGLDPKRLQAQSVKNAYLDIADAIGSVTSAQQRLDIATQLFGRGGQGMISMMLDGRGGFADAAKNANAFGLAISRIDAAKVEQANDAITLASSAIAGIARVAAVQFSPAVEAIATGFANWASSGTNAVDAVNAAFTVALGTVKIFAGTIQGLGDLAQRLLVTFYGIRNAVAWLSGGTSIEMQNELSQAIIDFDRMQNAPRWVDQVDAFAKRAQASSTKTATATAARNNGLEIQEENNQLLRQIARNTRTVADQGSDTVNF